MPALTAPAHFPRHGRPALADIGSGLPGSRFAITRIARVGGRGKCADTAIAGDPLL